MNATLSARPVHGVAPLLRNSKKTLRIRCQAQVGDKVLPMLRGPADLLFLGPRVAIGALLSTSQNLERLPADVERLTALASDPRPLEEKQNELLLELEDRVATFIERGLIAENEVISAVNNVIPEEVKANIPEEVRKIVLTPRPIPSEEANDWTTAPAPGYGNTDTKPMATWTISSVDDDDKTFGSSSSAAGNNDNEPPATAATVAASQAAAELVEIESGVLFVRDQLQALQSNSDPSKSSMLKLNLKEATQSLTGRLNQRVMPIGTDPEVIAAVQEAEALLKEVESLLYS